MKRFARFVFSALSFFLLVILLSATATLPAAAAADLVVRVVDADGAAVSDARVTLVETRSTLFSDASGSLTFPDVAAGEYHLEGASPRSGSGVLELDWDGSTSPVTLRLGRSFHREKIIVTASRGGHGSDELITPAQSLDETDLSERGRATLGDTLAKQPGVSATSFSPGSSRPVIRGQSGGRVRVLESGTGTGDASTSSPDHAVSVDGSTARSIEIVRGPATLLYGGSAIGGVVNVLDGRIPEAVPSKAVSGSLRVEFGTAADENAQALVLDGGQGAFAWHVDASRRDAGTVDIPGLAVVGDPSGPNGSLPNSALDTETATVGGSWIGERGFLGASIRSFETDYGIPAALEGPAGIRIDLEQRRVDLRGAVRGDWGPFDELSFRAGGTDYEHAEIEDGDVGTRFFNESREIRVEALQGGGTTAGVLGLQLTTRDFEAVGDEAFLPPSETESIALFALEEFDRGRWHYEIGGRFERADVSTDVTVAAEPLCTDPVDRDFDLWSGAVGVGVDLDDEWRVGANLSRSARAPSAEELFSCGEHAATLAFEIGDPSLSEETAVGIDLSLRKRAGRVTGALALYAQRFDDFIYEFDTGTVEPPGDPDGLPVFVATAADAEFLGWEGRIVYDVLGAGPHDFDLELRADRTDAELRGSGETLPRIPASRAGVAARYRGPTWSASLEWLEVDDVDDPAASETATEGYREISATAGYRYLRGDVVHEFMLRGTNLADETIRPHASRLKDLVPLQGRNVSFVYRLLF